jgi:hypothetical protein
MSLVKYNNNPKVTDQILFDFYTPDASNCFDNDPATIDTIKIFFISRSQTEIKDLMTADNSFDFELERNYNIKSQEVCDNPNDPEYEKAKSRAYELLQASRKSFVSYYTAATPVFCAGDNCNSNVCMSVASLVRMMADLDENTYGYTFSNVALSTTQDVNVTFGISCDSVPIRLYLKNISGNGGVAKITTKIGGVSTNYTVNDGATFDQTFSMDENDEVIITRNNTGTTWAANTMQGWIKVGTCNDKDCISGWYQPVWTRGGDNTYSVVKKITDDSQFPYGHFSFTWTPNSVKEGDYYICYTYTPNSGGSALSNFIKFYVAANIQNEVAIPAHATSVGKYDTLMDAYLPEMYKTTYTVSDKSPETIKNLNHSVSQGFTGIEDQAARIIDILNANSTPEPYLPYLANFFGLKLRSTDITKWRGQIINAVPQFKKKGTLAGLTQALYQAGIKMNKFYQYWQVGTENAWTEGFFFTGSYSFDLKKISLNIAVDPVAGVNIFQVWVNKRSTSGYSGYVVTSISTISITTTDGISTMTWNSVTEPLELGSYIKVTYQTKTFKDMSDYNLYVYWKDYLILQDDRSELEVTYPPKNFNTRLITEDDTLFNIFIPVANPFQPQVVFGKVRTVFPYSENIYNMDEYNGSLRDSSDPLDMDKSYLDTCSGFISSHFGLDVEVEDLSTFREEECREIIVDYTPYHAILRTLSFANVLEDFILPPVEHIECIINIDYDDLFIAGSGQNVFTRDILTIPSNFNFLTRSPEPVADYNIFRDDLASYVGVQDSGTTNFYNDNLNVVIASDTLQTNSGVVSTNLEDIGISPGFASIKILNPSANAGTYNIENPFKNGFTITAGQIADGSVVLSDFSFILSNKVCEASLANPFTVSDASLYMLSDDNLDFTAYNITTLVDVQNGFATGTWKITLASGTYDIYDINNKTIYLKNDGTLSTSNSTVTYTLKNAASSTVTTSSTGQYSVIKLAKIIATNGLCSNMPMAKLTSPSPNIYFDDGSGSQYKFYSIVDGLPTGQTGVIVVGMTASYAGSTNTNGIFYNRLLEETVGRFKYSGMKILKQAGMPQFIKAEDRITRDQPIPENFILTLNFGGSDYNYFLDLKSDEYQPASSSYIHIKGRFMSGGVTNATSVTYSLKEYAPNSKVYVRASTANGFDFRLKDYALMYGSLGIKTVQNVKDGTAVNPYKVRINEIMYNILKLYNNELYLEDINSLPVDNIINLNYDILDGNDKVIASSTSGDFQAYKIPQYVYYIDRSGQDVMQSDTGNVGFPFYLDAKSLTQKDSGKPNGPTSTVVADDSVGYIIKYKDGGEERREIK